MIWAFLVYTVGVFATWSSRTYNPDPTSLIDSDELFVAFAWPIFAIAFIMERIS